MRKLIDEPFKIRISDLHKQFKMRGYRNHTIAVFKRHGLRLAAKLVHRKSGRLAVLITATWKGQQYMEPTRVRLECKTQLLGSFYPYFICPGIVQTTGEDCEKHVQHLYLRTEARKIACRHCLGLKYISRKYRKLDLSPPSKNPHLPLDVQWSSEAQEAVILKQTLSALFADNQGKLRDQSGPP